MKTGRCPQPLIPFSGFALGCTIDLSVVQQTGLHELSVFRSSASDFHKTGVEYWASMVLLFPSPIALI
jgi:hypothetical protein